VVDDASEPSQNANDSAELFVRQHYHDFFTARPTPPSSPLDE
jgi:hypothetical protein